MSTYIENIETLTLPVIAMRDTVAFPTITLNFEVEDRASRAAVQTANDGNSYVLLLLLTNVKDAHSMRLGDLASVGTVARIKQYYQDQYGMHVVAEGFSRATVQALHRDGDTVRADVMCKSVTEKDGTDDIWQEALCSTLEDAVQKIAVFSNAVSGEMLAAMRSMRDPGQLADFAAAHFLVRPYDKQQVLEEYRPSERADLAIRLLGTERQYLQCEAKIQSKVHANLSKMQRDGFLREQMHVIQEELGEGPQSEVDEYRNAVMKAKLPKLVHEKLLKEIDRLAQTPFGSAEASVIGNYLDVCLELPWNKSSRDRVDVAAAKKILDEDHDGLTKVKERILEFLAVKQLSPDLKNQMICLVGPPGVGKTSVAKSVARALHRKYARVSLGGIRDEADIRGHRKTYIGSMPGRLISAISDAGVNNPLILLDEIDKMSASAQGDPTSAMLEVLDAEQNHTFRDHFVELPFDLSGCLFIATANSLENVPRPLIDRMEIIELSTYTKTEKISIAEHHLIPKQMKRHGLNHRMFKIGDGVISAIIEDYTKEAGVRNLERRIADLCRKAAKKLVEDPSIRRVTVTKANLREYLGSHTVLPERIAEENEVGVVNGLAYTEAGGDMLKVEAVILEGTGKVELTGSLGDVMQESARLAVSFVRSVATEFHIPTDFYKTKDIHIHFPEGAVPKDGPSAGVTVVTALISALTGRPVKREVAMTGEITLHGRVLAIGGLKEKTMAAYAAGIQTVCIPTDNMRDMEDLDPTARAHLHFVPCKYLSDVLKEALLPESNPAEVSERATESVSVTCTVSPVGVSAKER